MHAGVAPPKPEVLPVSELTELTDREARFVEAYVGAAERIGSKAAQLAGYHHPRVAACRLLKREAIRGAIEQYEAMVDKAVAPITTADIEAQDSIDADVRTVQERRWRKVWAPTSERRAILSRWARHTRYAVYAIKAIDTLNRMDGVYIEKHEHAVLTPRPVVHEHATDFRPVQIGGQGETEQNP
jgi:hypothetical protein